MMKTVIKIQVMKTVAKCRLRKRDEKSVNKRKICLSVRWGSIVYKSSLQECW